MSWPPNQAWPGSRGRGHGLGWAGWLAGWAWEVAKGRTDSTRKKREREREGESNTLTAGLIAYLNADVSRLTYLWKR